MPFGHLDRRQTRVIATGRVEIDAKLDLHGYRQIDAYTALRGFLAGAQARGHRVVLIITGKGLRKSRSDWQDGEYEPGVLRRMVPRWLMEPEFRQMVIEFGASDIRHGGDGALYVRVRRRR